MRILTVLAGLFLLPSTIIAQGTRLSLQDAINLAVRNNITVKNAKLDIEKQKALNAEITGLAYPQINGTGEFMKYTDQVKTFVPGEFFGQPGTFQPVAFTPTYSTNASVSASQLLFDGSVLVALQARKAVLKLFEDREKLAEEELKFNVITAYYSLVISQKQFEIQKDALRNLRTLTHEMDVMYKTGVAEKIAVDRMRVLLNNSSVDSLRTQNLITLSEQSLKYQLGLPLEQKIILTDTAIEKNLSDINRLLNQSFDYTLRKEYIVLQTQLRLNEYDLKRYKLARLPTLSAFAGAGYNYATEQFSDVFDSQYPFNSFIGLRLNVPIFSGLQKVNKIKQAKLEVEKTRNTMQDLQLGFNLQYAQAKTQLRNSMLTLQAQQENLTLATQVLDLAKTKYREGVGSNTEIVDAQNAFLQTQANYFLALMEVINSRTSLEKQLGLIQ